MNSVPCARIFSKMGLIVQNRRRCLSSDKASMAGMITINLQLIDKPDNVDTEDDDYFSDRWVR